MEGGHSPMLAPEAKPTKTESTALKAETQPAAETEAEVDASYVPRPPTPPKSVEASPLVVPSGAGPPSPMLAATAPKERKVSFSAVEAVDAGKAVLDAIDKLAKEAKEAQQHAARLARLEGKLDCAEARSGKMRRRSKDLQDQIMHLMDGSLERAFRQFDLDSSGTLDRGELQEAFRAAGRPISDEQLAKSIKMLDKNGDGVIDLDEFKAIALNCSMQS